MARYKQGETLKSVFRYDDYRVFLHDFFSEQKNIRPSFTQRFFARKAGFNSHSFCPLVIKGKRRLTAESSEKIIAALPLKSEAAEYFRTLVAYNQSNTVDEKQGFFLKLRELREKSRFSKIDKKAFPFFDKWYYPVVRALAAYSDWGGDYRKLAKMVRPRLGMEETRSAVEALVSTGLLIREEKGCFRVSANQITTLDVPGIVRNKNRRDILQQCINNSEIMTPDERYLAYTTLVTSEKKYKEIVDYLDSVRARVIEMVMAEPVNDKVYQLVFNVVPFSEKFESAKTGEAGNA